MTNSPWVMSSNRKGDRRERELVNRLADDGIAVMRAPASGSATARDLPDVLAGDGEAFYAIEVKSSADKPIYLRGEEVESLIYFARNFGANPRIGVRFDTEDWFFFHPDELHITDGGNYRVKKEQALFEGTPIDDLFGAAEDGDGGMDVERILDAYDTGVFSREEALDLLRELAA